MNLLIFIAVNLGFVNILFEKLLSSSDRYEFVEDEQNNILRSVEVMRCERIELYWLLRPNVIKM